MISWLLVVLALASAKIIEYWAPRLAARLIRAVSLLLPCPARDRYRQEWLAELDQASEEGRPLSFALLAVLPAAWCSQLGGAPARPGGWPAPLPPAWCTG